MQTDAWLNVPAILLRVGGIPFVDVELRKKRYIPLMVTGVMNARRCHTHTHTHTHTRALAARIVR